MTTQSTKRRAHIVVGTALAFAGVMAAPGRARADSTRASPFAAAREVAHAQAPGAEPRESARQLYERGVAEYDQKSYAEGARWFLRAWRESPRDATLEMAFRSVEKSEDPFAALEVVDASEEAIVGGRFAEHASALEQWARPRLSEVRVVCTSPCSFRIDGSPWRETFFRAAPGRHQVEIRVGSRVEARSIETTGGQRMDLILPEIREPAPEARMSSAWFFTSATLTAAAAGFTLWSALDASRFDDAYARYASAGNAEGLALAQTRTYVGLGCTAGLLAITVGLAVASTPWRSRPSRVAQNLSSLKVEF